jgi:hypothetical protein
VTELRHLTETVVVRPVPKREATAERVECADDVRRDGYLWPAPGEVEQAFVEARKGRT